MKITFLLFLLAGCTTHHAGNGIKHQQRVNQRGRDRHLQRDQKIQKRNFFGM